jgi:hypothetical protein
MSVLHVVLQQLGGPDCGMITQGPRILSEGRLDHRVDNPGERRRATRTRGVEEARPEVEALALEEAVRPVVHGLTADLEGLRRPARRGAPRRARAAPGRDTAPWPKGSGARDLPVPDAGEHSRESEPSRPPLFQVPR